MHGKAYTSEQHIVRLVNSTGPSIKTR